MVVSLYNGRFHWKILNWPYLLYGWPDIGTFHCSHLIMIYKLKYQLRQTSHCFISLLLNYSLKFNYFLLLILEISSGSRFKICKKKNPISFIFFSEKFFILTFYPGVNKIFFFFSFVKFAPELFKLKKDEFVVK